MLARISPPTNKSAQGLVISTITSAKEENTNIAHNLLLTLKFSSFNKL